MLFVSDIVNIIKLEMRYESDMQRTRGVRNGYKRL